MYGGGYGRGFGGPGGFGMGGPGRGRYRPGAYGGGYGYGNQYVRAGRMLLPLLMALGSRLQQMPRTPVVSVGLLGLCLAAFYSPPELAGLFPSVAEGCLRPSAFWHGVDWVRVVFSPFLHGNEWHIYHNMSSLLYKGFNLELAMGSVPYGLLVLYLVLASEFLYLAISAVLTGMGFLAAERAHTCVIGFSAVLFGMKVVLDRNSAGDSYVWGIRVPTRFAAWLELVTIQMVAGPQTSFLGHLCGILAGHLYVRFLQGQLGTLATALQRLLKSLTQGPAGPPPRGGGTGRTYGRGTTGGGGASTSSGHSSSYRQHRSREEEDIREAMRRSRFDR